ncbi:Scr1 family TA system antitoxin-like transcriptional regulator [Streptomyces bikiniensis]|uniref:Scr1 family TA system antitoxin-like transcriptional regulator n=1 Tax=Streptomyces bikiniensis TaxID=1896 RepID=UPI0004C08ED2|nr:Scr1 family TA system antitoxin-like transcriptional regulator [Streptomyces bikiniensis]
MTRAEAVQCFTSDRLPEPFQAEGYAAAWPFHRPPATYAGPKGLEIPCPRAGVGTKRWTPVLDEAVPGRTRGRPAMTADQLGHLLELSRTPHVEVRVLRLNTELALPVAFLAGHRLADQGTLWRQDGCTYADADAHEERGLMFGRPLRHAVGVEESRELIAKAREGTRLVARAMKPVPYEQEAQGRQAVVASARTRLCRATARQGALFREQTTGIERAFPAGAHVNDGRGGALVASGSEEEACDGFERCIGALRAAGSPFAAIHSFG